jgi:hypothetical protein
MKKELRDTTDGCALLEFLVQKLGSSKKNFTPAFCDEHVTEFRRRWLAAGKDDACVGSLTPATVYRHVKPLLTRSHKLYERDWERVFRKARKVFLPAEYPDLAALPEGWSLLRYLTATATNQVVVMERAQVGKLQAQIVRLEGALEHVQGKQDREVEVEVEVEVEMEVEEEQETVEEKLRKCLMMVAVVMVRWWQWWSWCLSWWS